MSEGYIRLLRVLVSLSLHMNHSSLSPCINQAAGRRLRRSCHELVDGHHLISGTSV